MTTIQATTLKNGLRVVTDQVRDVGSVAAGIWAAAGTRHEELEYNGAAHMVEHMLFKGTPTRSARQIAESIEARGGKMNAYTSREITSYHIHLMKEDLGLAMDVLADMYQNATLPDDEMERERHVILQEIGMCIDTPDDLVFDHFFETAYPEQGFGAPILGRADIIQAMPRAALQNFISRFYTPKNTVISGAGNLDHDEFVDCVETFFTDLPEDQPYKTPPARYTGGERREEKELEQSHIILGFPGVSRSDSAYYALQALASILGGGMSSRLFQEVRERRGLVYSIFSFHMAYGDQGQFGIYAGTGPEKLAELMPVLCDEIRKAAKDISQDELTRAQSQLKSQLIMGRENMLSRADMQAKNFIYDGRALDPERQIAEIEALRLADIQSAASRLFSAKPTLAALGPVGYLEPFKAIEDRLRA